MISKYVFGPAPSRRFGRSLGVNPLPRKTCNYSCVYCQLGRTPKLQGQRVTIYPTQEVLRDVRIAIEELGDSIDYITYMGDGEPTLAANLGEMVSGTRELWKGKMALITNGSMFHLEEVREAVQPFDIISPTVSAGDERTYRRLHRPIRSLNLAKVLSGLERLRQEFQGEIWAELMLVRGVNDSLPSLLNIRKVIRNLGADRVYISVPTRPPAESWVLPPTEETMRQVFDLFPEAVDMTMPEEEPFLRNEGERQAELLEIAKNHPLREDQAMEMLSFAMGEEKACECLREMVEDGRLRKANYGGKTFYTVPLQKT
jgi:wyosine [tRNA(Phe)-imidazoG37] synthetase (radical SAM superfamily)